ncbi:MAG: hypothetical protein ACQEP5_07180 [Actinomycetota bacterium]
MIRGSKHLLPVYERLRSSELTCNRSGGSVPYGMSVLKDKGMLFWLRLCCYVEPVSTGAQPAAQSNIQSGNNYHGGFSVQLKDILVEMALNKIKKEYGLCHI